MKFDMNCFSKSNISIKKSTNFPDIYFVSHSNFQINQWLLLPFIILHLLRMMLILAVFCMVMITMKKAINLGLVIFFSVLGTFFLCMYIFHFQSSMIFLLIRFEEWFLVIFILFFPSGTWLYVGMCFEFIPSNFHCKIKQISCIVWWWSIETIGKIIGV